MHLGPIKNELLDSILHEYFFRKLFKTDENDIFAHSSLMINGGRLIVRHWLYTQPIPPLLKAISTPMANRIHNELFE